MKKLETVGEMQHAAAELRVQGKTIALVPTSGALHEGHVALIRAAKAKADAVVVSLFVNPLQFGPSENYAGYPRSPDAALAKCAELGVDLVFAPVAEEMYPRGFSTYVVEEAVSKPLCGVSRPTHFRGVTTVLVKLFNVVRPHFVVFGQKEAQQAAVVRKMIADLHFGVEVVVVPTVREEMAATGVRSADRIMAEVTHILSQHRRVRVIYVSIVDPTTMEAMREVVPGRTLLAIAAWVDEVRLTDNVLL
jgi:pantoate--beta-alanine ligase